MIRRAIILSAVLIFSVSCIRFKVELPDDPDLITDYITVLKSVEDRDLTGNIKDDPVSIENERIFGVIKVNNIEKSEKIRWSWFDADRKLVKISNPIPVNNKKVFLEYFIAWDILEKEKFTKKPGEWYVIVRSGRRILGFKKFIIQKNNSGTN